jgi:hypothetical protein
MMRLKTESFYILLTLLFIFIMNFVANASCDPDDDKYKPCRCCVNGNWVSGCCPGLDCCGSGGCCKTSHPCKSCKNGECVWCNDDPDKYCCDNKKCCDDDEGCCDGECYDKSTQGCCDGEIYSLTTQKCCPDDGFFSGEYVCDINVACCHGQCCSEGQACCNTSLILGTCYNTTAQKCCPGVGGSPDYICNIDEICCDDGSCAAPCEEMEMNPCNVEQSLACIGCVNLILGCSLFDEYVFTGNKPYNCWNGCPGDCSDRPRVLCHTKYQCTIVSEDYCALCVEVGPDEFECVDYLIGWTCYECGRGDEPGENYFHPINRRCNE